MASVNRRRACSAARAATARRVRECPARQIDDQQRLAVTLREVARERCPRRDFRRRRRRPGSNRRRRRAHSIPCAAPDRRAASLSDADTWPAIPAAWDNPRPNRLSGTSRRRRCRARAPHRARRGRRRIVRRRGASSANVAGGAPIYWNEIPGRLVFPHPEERAISAFTRVFDALWRASKDEGRGISGASFEARADARAPQDEEGGRKSRRQSRISLPLNPSYLLLARQFHEKRKPAAKRQRPLTPTLSPQAGRGSVKASREGIFIFTSPQWGEVARRSSEGAKAWRVRGIRRCRFARSVPPLPPRTFGARLPLPTGERESVTGRKCRVLQRNK